VPAWAPGAGPVSGFRPKPPRAKLGVDATTQVPANTAAKSLHDHVPCPFALLIAPDLIDQKTDCLGCSLSGSLGQNQSSTERSGKHPKRKKIEGEKDDEAHMRAPLGGRPKKIGVKSDGDGPPHLRGRGLAPRGALVLGRPF
jgi:hypothetical protein